MQLDWFSVDQVASTLGLHVRTVRGYIRDGRLPAARIGKQYRVRRSDLDVFTGRAADARRPTVEVSAVVEFDEIGAAAADRLSTLLVAGAQLSRGPTDALRIHTMYDGARSRLKILVLGGVGATADVLRTIDDLLGAENGIYDTDPAVRGG